MYAQIKERKEILKKEVLFDIGLGVLRPILAFCVVISHRYNSHYAFGKWKYFHRKTENLYFHVPTFFIMAFYFSHKTFISSNLKKKIRKIAKIIYTLYSLASHFFF